MKKLIGATVYAVAMGYLESAVVMYLRLIQGRDLMRVFPLRVLDSHVGLIEAGREFATIMMLAAVGYFLGRSKVGKFLYFVFAFAIWDLAYYLFLRLLIGWPQSFSTFDVLFLIPVVWISPVIAPILVAILLAVTSALLILYSEKYGARMIGTRATWTFLAGCALILYSFTSETFHILFTIGPQGMESYSPGSFNWLAFGAGFVLMLFSAVKALKDSYQK